MEIMTMAPAEQRRRLEQLDRDARVAYQLDRLNRLLKTILPDNAFYATKLGRHVPAIDSLEALATLPLTEKLELAGDDARGWAANRTYDRSQYVRWHQTSGSTGRPMVVMDTQDDWAWWIDAWQFVLDAAEVTCDDVCMMAFSFGPFIGFWSAFDAAVARGCLVVPGGGLSTLARLERIETAGATVLFCTPSYALHMADVAQEHGISVANLPVRRIIVAGEPGGSVPATRARIEQMWDAKVIDHGGATEVGPWGYGDLDGEGLYVNESEFLAEFLSVESGKPAGDGELAELVLTALGRAGSPVLRYRTGDHVRPTWNHDGSVRFVRLTGGVLGRADDMMIIRGVNLYPSSIEQSLRQIPEVAEYRLTVTRRGAMDHLVIDVEDPLNDPARIAEQLQLQLGLNVEVRLVPLGSLPRFEAKAKRLIDRRSVVP